MAGPRRRSGSACPSSDCCSAWPWRASGSPPTPSGRCGLLILVRSALGRVLAILGLIGITGDPRLHGHQRPARDAGGDPGFGNLTFLLIMVALTLRRGRRRGPPPDRLDRRRDALRDRRARGPRRRSSSSARSRPGKLGTRRSSSGRWRSRRSRWRSCSAFGSLVVFALFVARRPGRVRAAGARRPPRTTRSACSIRPASRPEGWLRLGPAARDPGRLGGSPAWSILPVAVYVVSYIPWALIENHQLFAGLAARPHRPDAARPDRPDVRLPQQPDRRRTRRPRRGGPGRSTSSPSGSTRRASPAAPRPRSTTRATSSSGGWGSRPWPSSPGMAFKRRSLALR